MGASSECTPAEERLHPLYDRVGDYVALEVSKSDLMDNLFNYINETQIDAANCAPLVKPLSNHFGNEKGSV